MIFCNEKSVIAWVCFSVCAFGVSVHVRFDGIESARRKNILKKQDVDSWRNKSSYFTSNKMNHFFTIAFFIFFKLESNPFFVTKIMEKKTINHTD